MKTYAKIKRHLFLNNKVARKVFLTFVLCAVFPLLSTSVISFFYVGRQLETDAMQRLRQQCKNKGFYIYDRLNALESDLKDIASRQANGFPGKIEQRPYDPINRSGSGWRRIFIRTPNGRCLILVENASRLASIPFTTLRPPQGYKPIIDIFHSDDISPAIFMTMYLDPKQPAKGTITGEIDPIYLWGIGNMGALLPGIDFSVILGEKKILISSIPDYLISGEFLDAFRHDSFSGIFESTHDGNRQINTYWSLFLNHQFSSPDWTIIFSQSKSSIMAPVNSFKLIFFLLVLLTFWVVLLLSIRSIQRRTIPIVKLKAGAQKIAEGDFDSRVEVDTGDEYEELAEAFNDMGAKLKKSQMMMLQAAKMSAFGQMGAGIVHEIGQPLGALSGFAELLQLDVSPEKKRKYVDTIVKETARLRKVISKFRTFARDSDDIFKPIYLSEVLQNTLNLMDHQLKIKGVDFKMQSTDHLPPVYGDKNGLQQVFLNLISNAMDALEDKPTNERNIHIKASVDKDLIQVVVADNGAGIPEDIQQSIFDPFFTTKGEETGTGLGLSIIGTILQKHRATINVSSQVNQGTSFSLSFPIFHEDPSAKSSSATV